MNYTIVNINYMRYLICKTRISSIYGMTAQSRGYGKTMTTQALYRAITTQFARYFKVISVRWCTSFEVFDNGKRRYCYVYVAEK